MPGKRCVEVSERYLLCSVDAEQILEILENGFSENEAAQTGMHTAANYLCDNSEAGLGPKVQVVEWYGQVHIH